MVKEEINNIKRLFTAGNEPIGFYIAEDAAGLFLESSAGFYISVKIEKLRPLPLFGKKAGGGRFNVKKMKKI